MKSNYESAFQFVKSKAIASHYPTFTLDQFEDDAFISTLQFMEKFQPDTAVLVCQRSESPGLQYASENFKNVLGYNSKTMMRMSFEDYLDLIHRDDIDRVLQCFSFINDYEPYDPLQYRFEMYYRIKNKQGGYILLCEEKMSIRNVAGKYIYLNACRDVTAKEKFHDVKLLVHHCIQGEFKHIYTYHPRQSSTAFTPRQKDIVQLVSKGFTNKEIADQLNISINTIKNHKNLLFKKANVRTSMELFSLTNALHSD